MSKATYTASFEPFAGSDCLFIIDLNNGGMSVTNDIENIVKTECEILGSKNPNELMIVYSDSEGMWDGWDNKTQSFVPLNCNNQYHAIRRWKKQLQEVTNFNNINTIKMNGDNTTGEVLDAQLGATTEEQTPETSKEEVAGTTENPNGAVANNDLVSKDEEDQEGNEDDDDGE